MSLGGSIHIFDKNEKSNIGKSYDDTKFVCDYEKEKTVENERQFLIDEDKNGDGDEGRDRLKMKRSNEIDDIDSQKNKDAFQECNNNINNGIKNRNNILEITRNNKNEYEFYNQYDNQYEKEKDKKEEEEEEDDEENEENNLLNRNIADAVHSESLLLSWRNLAPRGAYLHRLLILTELFENFNLVLNAENKKPFSFFSFINNNFFIVLYYIRDCLKMWLDSLNYFLSLFFSILLRTYSGKV